MSCLLSSCHSLGSTAGSIFCSRLPGSAAGASCLSAASAAMAFTQMGQAALGSSSSSISRVATTRRALEQSSWHAGAGTGPPQNVRCQLRSVLALKTILPLQGTSRTSAQCRNRYQALLEGHRAAAARQCTALLAASPGPEPLVAAHARKVSKPACTLGVAAGVAYAPHTRAVRAALPSHRQQCLKSCDVMQYRLLCAGQARCHA